MSAASPALVDYILPTASIISAGALAYLARAAGRFARKLNRQMDEHDWLIAAVNENTRAIKKILERLDPEPKYRSARQRRPQ